MKPLDRDGAGRELGRLMRIIRREREALAAHVKDARARIAKLEERAEQLALIADGAAIQTELDTEAAADVDEVLGRAAEVAERKGRRS